MSTNQTFYFKNWQECLAASEMRENHKKSHRDTIIGYLAVDEGVGAATQRQALNAGVFYLREVLKQEMGDFSDYVALEDLLFEVFIALGEPFGEGRRRASARPT